jgi:hypothetical protein
MPKRCQQTGNRVTWDCGTRRAAADGSEETEMSAGLHPSQQKAATKFYNVTIVLKSDETFVCGHLIAYGFSEDEVRHSVNETLERTKNNPLAIKSMLEIDPDN